MGSYLAKFQIFDPIPNIAYDNLFDFSILLLWIIIPIVKNYHWNKEQKMYYYYPLILGILSYFYGMIISYLFYSNYHIELASFLSLIVIFSYQLIIIILI